MPCFPRLSFDEFVGTIFFDPIPTTRRNRNGLNPCQTKSIANAGSFQGSHFPFEDKSPAD